MNYYCDMCGELMTDLKCTNEDYEGDRCPMFGIKQIWQTMRATTAPVDTTEVING